MSAVDGVVSLGAGLPNAAVNVVVSLAVVFPNKEVAEENTGAVVLGVTSATLKGMTEDVGVQGVAGASTTVVA